VTLEQLPLVISNAIPGFTFPEPHREQQITDPRISMIVDRHAHRLIRWLETRMPSHRRRQLAQLPVRAITQHAPCIESIHKGAIELKFEQRRHYGNYLANGRLDPSTLLDTWKPLWMKQYKGRYRAEMQRIVSYWSMQQRSPPTQSPSCLLFIKYGMCAMPNAYGNPAAAINKCRELCGIQKEHVTTVLDVSYKRKPHVAIQICD
jgi:hypothetical protein